MSKFDNSAAHAARMAILDSIDPEILNKPVDPSPAGIKEIAELLSFLPPEKREAAVRGFCATALNN